MSAALDSARLQILMAVPVPRKREGGGAIIAYHLGEHLQERGHEVSYLFQEDLFGKERISGRFSQLSFASRLKRYICEHRDKFSIVNLHAPSGLLYGMYRHFVGSKGLPPQVMTLHGLEERRIHVQSREAEKGHAWNFGWKNRMWHRFYTFPLYRWTIRTADGAHTYSRDVWNMLQLSYNLNGDRVAYIPNGVEKRFFLPRRYDSPGPLKLLYAGTWLDQRGIYYLRDALKQLAKQLPGLTMTFAGCACAPEMIREFFGPDLASVVVPEPVVPSERMHELFAAHDIFLFPSLMEGLPSVLLEAMASGMPVITAETCGMPDVVEDGYNGLLVPPGDATAIENAVLRLAGPGALREELGKAAQQTMSRYTWERAAVKLEEFFRHVIALEARKPG